MAQATIQVSRAILQSVWPESPTTESIAKALLLPAAYKVVSIDDNSSLDHISVLVESDVIPDGTRRETIRRETTFGHMQML